MSFRKQRRHKGSTSVELAASLLFIIPITFTILYVVVEMVTAYSINSVLSQAATNSARQLALLYPDNPGLAQRSSQDVMVYDKISYGGIIVNHGQFDTAIFNLAADPPTVTVKVNYTGGQYGLNPFPSYDPLHLASKIQLSGTSIYKIEAN